MRDLIVAFLAKLKEKKINEFDKEAIIKLIHLYEFLEKKELIAVIASKLENIEITKDSVESDLLEMRLKSIYFTLDKRYKRMLEFSGFRIYEYPHTVDIFIAAIADTDSLLNEIANYKFSSIDIYVGKKSYKSLTSPSSEELLKIIKENKFKEIKLKCFLVK
jgi:hypothetical protein